MKPKALITGAAGMLGKDMAKALEEAFEVIAMSKKRLDITDYTQVQKSFTSIAPEAVINCAAFTKVDLCEDQSQVAFDVNAKGPENLAKACKKLNIKLIHISTDYVFDGTATTPYREDHPPNPINVYGRSKLQGENYITQTCPNHLIVRTSWLFGKEGPNFIKTMLELSKTRESLQVVNDQMGRPTYTKDLSMAVLLLLKNNAQGIVHFANSGCCTWYDLCCYALKKAGRNKVNVEPISSDRFKRPAKRPKYSVLNLERFEKITGQRPRPWQEAVDSFLIEIGEYAG